jgi:putative peptidoglycan lipid II flippase
MRFALVSLTIDITLAVSLFFLFGVLAIPVATATGAWIYAALLGVTLWRRGHLQPDARLKSRLVRIALASAVMGAALIGLEIMLWDWFQGSTGRRLLALLILCGSGLGIYVAAAFALKAVTIAELKEQFTREKGAPREAAPAFDEA